jgi:hypothetical protein
MATFPKVWSEQLLGELPQTVRSKWRGGRWLDAAEGALRFAAPNQWHLKACEEGRLDVEKVLANHFGHRIPVRLVDEGGGVAASPPAGSGPAPAEPPPDDHEDVPHPTEIADLPDAVTAVSLSPEVVDPDDVDMLQDLIVAAVHDAAAKVSAMQREALGMLGQIDLGALGGLFGGSGGSGGAGGSGPQG